jgi:putative GTP pyrophosphokinase
VTDVELEQIVSVIQESLERFEIFQSTVVSTFTKDRQLNGDPPVVHSIRARMKDLTHLKDKIRRKHSADNPITIDNIFSRVTDIAGVRILHLHQQEFGAIHDCVNRQVQQGDWILAEEPKAYTWDPESREFFEAFRLKVEVKESFYTSIHYVVRPRPEAPMSCEIQVRNLFEEIWGEVDHRINYPIPTESLACREQLRVLARLVGAGSRLLDAIHRVHGEQG